MEILALEMLKCGMSAKESHWGQEKVMLFADGKTILRTGLHKSHHLLQMSDREPRDVVFACLFSLPLTAPLLFCSSPGEWELSISMYEFELVWMLGLLLHCGLLDTWFPACDALWEVLETLEGGD